MSALPQNNSKDEHWHALVHESFLCVRKFTQLVPYHVLCYHDRDVVLPVMYEKADPA
jgi:hypothetical protein